MKIPWLRVTFDTWWLGFECANVMALRAFAIAIGGSLAKIEAHRMVEEKIKALIALQALVFTGALVLRFPEIAAGSVRHYRKAVRANRRRLSKRR